MTTEGTVVVVEDEPSIALLESEVLEEAGFKVESFTLGHEALRYLSSQGADLIVLDYFLPDMNGSEFVEALSEETAAGAVTSGTTCEPPVVVVSGHSDPRVAREMKEAGVLDYIVKDPSLRFLEELPRTVRMVLDQR